MKLKSNSTAQKLRGSYYTPSVLAEKMVDLFNSHKANDILEPSCGDGVFIDALYSRNAITDDTHVVGLDIDDKAIASLKKKYPGNSKLDISCQDFFEYYKSNQETKFDLILGNPPYIRYQYMTNNQRELLSSILIKHKMKANKLVNAWVGFMVACTSMLKEDGKIAFVIPAEILQVVYAEDLRFFLSESFSKITLLTFEKLIFDDIEQEIVVFVGEKGVSDSQIRIAQLKDLDDLSVFDLESNGFQPLSHVHEKWTKYFMSEKDTQLISDLRKDKRLIPFSELALINIGITTGNNKFFSIDSDTAKEYDLKPFLMPLIGRSAHASGVFYTKDDWEKNIAQGKRAQLLVLNNKDKSCFTKPVLNYLKEGEERGENKGYKCSIRDPWYTMPSVWVPDAFFLRRNNLYPKLVINECNAVSTDTMHRIKLNEGVNSKHLLLSYYNSISFAFTELCGRSYGGGVLEILPKEVGNVLLPLIDELEEAISDRLIEYLDNVVRSGDDIEGVLDLVDKEVLIDSLGFDAEVCTSCRKIWKTLQGRRLGRGR